ncbi:MAG: hypothetical protein IIV45_05910, partial [Lachnospiraceae bacterium]|nr:hypothetical protein [Lachnospiraceae bacterium]
GHSFTYKHTLPSFCIGLSIFSSGIRDLEQVAEHMAANALYQIEVDHVAQVVFDSKMVRDLLAL